MTRHINITSPQNAHIDMNEPYDIKYWSTALRITTDRLKEAVSKVGSSIKEVRAYLGK